MDTIVGQEYYISDRGIGTGHYYFGFPLTVNNGYGGSYTDYSKPFDNWYLADRSKPPHKKYFFNPKYDKETRTFSGTQDWIGNTFYGYGTREYTMVFSKDFKIIESGSILNRKEDGTFIDEITYGPNSYY